MLQLAIDRGNTVTKWGLFQDKEIIDSGQIGNFSMPKLEQLTSKLQPRYVILSSTKHLSKRMQNHFAKQRDYFILSEHLQFPFKVAYQTPETLGRDRLAGIAGAWALFPGENSLVIDAGTCITYDLITKKGIYKGGNISPGVRLRLQSLHAFTDKLPIVPPAEEPADLGIDTRSALQVGAQVGALQEMQGFIDSYRKKLKKLNILLTGGDAAFFVYRMKTKIFASPQLVLLGLNEILQYNVQKLS